MNQTIPTERLAQIIEEWRGREGDLWEFDTSIQRKIRSILERKYPNTLFYTADKILVKINRMDAWYTELQDLYFDYNLEEKINDSKEILFVQAKELVPIIKEWRESGGIVSHFDRTKSKEIFRVLKGSRKWMKFETANNIMSGIDECWYERIPEEFFVRSTKPPS